MRPKERAPEKIVRYVAARSSPRIPRRWIPMPAARKGAGRDTTRREHLAEIVSAYGFRHFGDDGVRRELSGWLAGIAAQTDSGPALAEALLEEMRRRGIVAPAISAAEELAWEARRRAGEEAARALTAGLSGTQLECLDAMLDTAPDTARSELVWLRSPPGAPSPANFLKVAEKLRFVRSLGLSRDATRAVHHNRLGRLAAEGPHMTPQNLSTLEAGRRRATLVAYLLERSASLTDEALEMHDRMVGEAMAGAKRTRDENLKGRGRQVNEKGGRAMEGTLGAER